MAGKTMRMEIRGLKQGYGERVVIDNVDMDAESGQVVTILGPNGSGKSTMIKTICNIMRPMAGSITIDGKDVNDIPRRQYAKIVGYVPQTAMYFGYSTVYDAVLLGRRPYVKWNYSHEDIDIAADAMVKMRVDDLYDRSLSELSGGQKQRVTLARSIAQDPVFYIFDEPTSALDLRHQLDTLKVMRSIIKEKGACMIIAMHDMNLAYRYSDKVLVLKDGGTYDFGDTQDVITPKMIKDVYGVESEIVEGPRGRFIHSYDDDLDDMVGY